MGQLISLLTVVLFSITSLADDSLGSKAQTDFSPLINENILEQELTAENISKSTQFASAQDEPALVESIKTVPTGNGEEAKAAQQAAAAEAAKRNPSNEKDFQLKLHPTGLASAKRYFPPKPAQPVKRKVAKASKESKKVVKASKKSSKVVKASEKPSKEEKLSKNSAKTVKVEKKYKAKKSKNNGRSTASIKKKSKSKKSTAQTASSGKI